MRDRIRLELTPAQYREAKAYERRLMLSALLNDLARARKTQEAWYEWVLEHRRQRLAALGDSSSGFPDVADLAELEGHPLALDVPALDGAEQ